MALRQTAGLLEDGARTFYEESDVALAREALPGQLKLVEGLLASEPSNKSLLFVASQGFSSYAFLFLEDSEPERAKAFYLRGKDYGMRALGLSPSADLSSLEQALKKISRSQAPALFWAAYGWSGYINLARDSAEAIADLPKTVAMMQRAQELWPDYNFGGPDLYFGVYYAVRPKILGGDPAKSKAHFDAAARLNGGTFLMGDVLQAKAYAVAVQDEELFKTLLNRVLESPAGRQPRARLADEVAKLKARRLLENKNEYF